MKKTVILSLSAILATAGMTAAQMTDGMDPASSEAGPEGSKRTQRRAHMRGRADADKDGQIAREERKALREERRKAHFQHKDRNRDGQLTPDEVPGMPAHVFAKIDRDDSGQLDPEEMRKAHRRRGMKPGHKRGLLKRLARRMFERTDINGDGKITRDEMRAAADRRFERMDADNSGDVSREELKRHRHGKRFGKHGQHRTKDKPKRHGAHGKRAHAKWGPRTASL